MHKTRPAHDALPVTEIIGRVRDKIAIVGDDVTTTGNTLIAGAQALKERGAKDVWIFVKARAAQPRRAGECSATPRCRGIVATDTLPDRPADPARQHDRPAGCGTARRDDHERLADDSVSAIFGGDTQLF